MKTEYDPFAELFKHEFKDNEKAAHYLRKYIALIKAYQNSNQPLQGYCEVHHIVPRSWGGPNVKLNLIKLPILAHIVVHHILAKTGDVAMVRSFCTLVSFNEDKLPTVKWFNIRGEQLKLRSQMLMKPVYNVNTQQRFQSIAEAATSIPGKNAQTVAGCIHNAINGKRRAYGYF